MTDQITPQPETALAPEPKKMNGAALTSMISGILTYLWWWPITSILDMSKWWAVVLAPISALVAVIAGARGKKLIRESQGTLGGKKMAAAGLWLGWIFIIGSIITTVVVIIIAVAAGNAIISTIQGLIG